MLRHCARLCSIALLLTAVSSAGCSAGSSAAARPDVSGQWDLTYDDFLELEIEVDDDVYQQRVSRAGGSIRARHAGREVRATVACERDEVICPNELWPRQLMLTNRIGQVDGERFSIWLHGEGQGACELGPSSLAIGELETVGEPGARYEATMLTGGRIVTELSAACLRSLGAGELPEHARVRISAGFSGVRRRAPVEATPAAPPSQKEAVDSSLGRFRS